MFARGLMAIMVNLVVNEGEQEQQGRFIDLNGERHQVYGESR